MKSIKMAFDSQNTNQEISLFRFNFNEESKIMYMNYFENPYKEWDSHKLEHIINYVSQYQKSDTSHCCFAEE